MRRLKLWTFAMTFEGRFFRFLGLRGFGQRQSGGGDRSPHGLRAVKVVGSAEEALPGAGARGSSLRLDGAGVGFGSIRPRADNVTAGNGLARRVTARAPIVVNIRESTFGHGGVLRGFGRGFGAGLPLRAGAGVLFAITGGTGSGEGKGCGTGSICGVGALGAGTGTVSTGGRGGAPGGGRAGRVGRAGDGAGTGSSG